MQRIILVSCLLLAYGLADSTDVELVPAINLPGVRSSPQIVLAGHKAIMLFGYLECFFAGTCDHYFYNDTFVADLSNNPVSWQSVHPTSTGGYPGVRAFFGADYWANAGKVVFYGGVFYNAEFTVFQPYGDIWFYDVHANRFEAVNPANAGPGIRIGVTLRVIGDAFYFFGGFDQTFQGHNDMWKFDLISQTWTQLIADSSSPSAPVPRYLYNGALATDNSKYWFFSGSTVDNGVDFNTANDTWYYDFASNSYVQVLSEAHSTNDGRIHGAATFHRGHFFVILGAENTNNEECPTISVAGPQGPTNTMIFLDTAHPSSGWQYADIGVDVIGLKRIAGVLLHGSFFFTSGFGFACPSAASSVPVWNSYLWKVDLNQLVDSLD